MNKSNDFEKKKFPNKIFFKCQTWVTSLWEIFHVKIFFADFHELKDVDSKNEKKKFSGKKNFFGT